MPSLGLAELRVALTGDDKLSAVIVKNQQSLQKWQDAASKASQESDVMRIDINTLKGSWTELNSQMDVIGGTISAVVAAFKQFHQFAEAGEVSQNVGTAFQQMQGNALKAEQAMGQLREASQGIVDDQALQQMANQMKFTGHTMDSIIVSLDAATKLSAATGVDIVQTATQISKAMKSGEAETLKNLGLYIDMNKALGEHASLLGKQADLLTVNEKTAAIQAAVMKELDVSIKGSGISTDAMNFSVRRLSSSLKNLEGSASEAAARFEQKALGVYDALMANEAFRDSVAGIVELTAKQNELHEDNFLAEKKGWKEKEKHRHAAEALVIRLGLEESATDELIEKMERLTHARGRNVDEIAEEIAAIVARSDERKRVHDQLEAQEKQQRRLTAEEAKAEKIQKRRATIESMSLAIQKARLIGNEEEAIHFKQRQAHAKIMNEFDQNKITAAMKFLRLEIADITAQKALQDLREKNAKKEAADGKRARDRIDKTKAKKESAAKAEAKQMFELRDLRAQIREARLKDDQRTKAEAIRFAREINAIKFEQRQSDGSSDEVFKAKLELAEAQHMRNLAGIKKTKNEERLRLEEENYEVIFQLAHEDARRHVVLRSETLEEIVSETHRVTGGLQDMSNDWSSLLRAQGKEFSTWQKVGVNSIGAVADIAQIASDNSKNLAKGVGASLSAVGKISEGTMKNKRKEASLRGAFEAAAAIASIASGDIPGAVQHTLASSMFFAIAGGAGSGGKRPRSPGSFGGGALETGREVGGGPTALTVNVNGFVSGSTNEVAKGMTDVLSGINQAGFVGGSI